MKSYRRRAFQKYGSGLGIRKDREICMLYDKDIREPLFDFLEEVKDYRRKTGREIKGGYCDGPTRAFDGN